jgi:hypothetical protein
MKRLFAGMGALTLTALALLAVPVHAQTAAATANSAKPFTYNISDEVTLKGTVSSVLKKSSQGMIVGSHLLVQTPSGTVDASLGRFAFLGKGALSVASGEQVQITGVMRTLKTKQVFMARIVEASGHTYTIRNKRGFPMSPQARERAIQKTTQKGEAL